MVNKQLCVFFLAAFVGVVVLGIGCNAQVTFQERAQPQALNVGGVRRIMAGIAIMINNIDVDDLYYGGQSLSATFPNVDNLQVTVRLYFYNRVNSITGWCSVNPVWSQVMRGQAMVDQFGVIYDAMVRSALEGFYGRMQAVAGSLGIEYFLQQPGAPPSSFTTKGSNNTMMSFFKPEERQNVSFDLDDESTCWVYSTCLISGVNGALGAYLASGASLVSGNRLHELIMQTDCNLVHYDISSGVYVATWASNTQNKALGCYAHLQTDGNLLILDSTGLNVVWATNRYCQPQPDCIITTALVVQDDRNVVIYNTDFRKPIWSIF